MLSDALKVAEGLAHGRTNIIFCHLGELRQRDNRVSLTIRPQIYIPYRRADIEISGFCLAALISLGAKLRASSEWGIGANLDFFTARVAQEE